MAGAHLVSMKDVARHAAVSVGTVSNVLNRPDIVSTDRRERVEAAIAELGYVRNDAARQLKLGQSRTVGAIVLDSGNPFYGQLVGGIEAAAEDSSLAVIAGSTGNREQRERLYSSLFEEQRVRGILLASTGGAQELVDGIRRRGTPVVLVESSRENVGVSSVGVDDIAGGEIAVRHLAELGRRRHRRGRGPAGPPAGRGSADGRTSRRGGRRHRARGARGGRPHRARRSRRRDADRGADRGGAARCRVLCQRSARRRRAAGLRLPSPDRRARGDRPGRLRRHRVRELHRGAADLCGPARGPHGPHRPRPARGGDRHSRRPAPARELHPDAGGAGVDDGLNTSSSTLARTRPRRDPGRVGTAPRERACSATFPSAVASTGPATTSRPSASAVSWLSRAFWLPPPTTCRRSGRGEPGETAGGVELVAVGLGEGLQDAPHELGRGAGAFVLCSSSGRAASVTLSAIRPGAR